MSAYYNEIDPFAAAWLRNLIDAGLIAPGDVDTRSIIEVQADDLKGYRQCHFFAGIGGWSYALRLAGWPDDREVWTGSCPCQPLSSAGQRKGHADERHLWPAFYRLIAERRPATVFGEQVASKDGREWLAGIRADLEDDRYAVGAADLCSPCVGAPNIRQRLYWVADTDGERCGRIDPLLLRPLEAGRNAPDFDEASRRGESGGLAITEYRGCEGRRAIRPRPGAVMPSGKACGLEYATSDGREQRRAEPSGRGTASGRGLGYWSDFDVIACADGKARRIEPGSFPLAHGVSGRVGLLRGYGNAIVPQLAAEFVKAYLECVT